MCQGDRIHHLRQKQTSLQTAMSVGAPTFNQSPLFSFASFSADLDGLARHLWRAFSILRCPPFELKRADEVERRMATDGL